MEEEPGGIEAFFDPAPVAVTLGRERGRAWLLDARNRSVLEVDTLTGSCVRALGLGLLIEPVDLALDHEGVLWVADALAGRVVGFRTATGEVHRVLGEGALTRPAGLAVDEAGRVFVSDAARHRLLRFDPREGLDLMIGEEGLGPGHGTCRPASPSTARNLLVVDHGNHRGVVLTPDGGFARAFGSKLLRPAMRPDIGEEDDEDLRSTAGLLLLGLAGCGGAEPSAPRIPGALSTEQRLQAPVAVGTPGEVSAVPPRPPAGLPGLSASTPTARGSRSSDHRPQPAAAQRAVHGSVAPADPSGQPLDPGLEGLTVDADMPAHGHGMNVAPALSLEDGWIVADPLLFHMPGAWEIYVDRSTGALTERAQVGFQVH